MFRSASGPGGLSINTGTANLFGSTPAQSTGTGTGFGTATAQQPQNTASLFGAPTPASGGLFGGGPTSQQQQQQQPTPGLFGQQPQQPQSSTGGLFGQPQQQQPTGGGIFGQPAQQQQQQTNTGGGIFGQPAQQQQQQMSLFGGGGTTTTPAATGGGLFGGGGATAQQSTQPTSLFGGGGTAQPAQQTGTTTTSLFGTAQPAQQQTTGTTTTTSLFGQPQQQQQQQQQQQTSLFGGTGGTSLFGSKPAGTTTGTTSLFGTTTQPTTTGGTLSLSLGQNTSSSSQQTTNTGSSKVDLPNLRSTTRFSDLTDSLQSQLTQIDESIQKCISDCNAINAFMPGHEQQLSSIPLDVSFVSRKSEGAASALNSDVLAIASLKETVKKDAANARLSFKAIDQLRLPGGYWQAGLWSSASRSAAGGGGGGQAAVGESGGGSGQNDGGAGGVVVVVASKSAGRKSSGGGSGGGAGTGGKTAQQQQQEEDEEEADEAESNQDLIGYFSKTADEMDEMMKRFESNLGEIEVHLHGVQGNVLEQLQRAASQKMQLDQEQGVNGEGQVDQKVVELAAVLRDFEESILKVAGVVGGVKEGITELQLREFMGNGS